MTALERNPQVPAPTAQHVGFYSPDQGIELEPLNWQRLDCQGSPLDLDFLSGVCPRLEWGHARPISSRAIAAVSRFPLRGSRDLWLSLEDFPRGFPTRLSHRAVPRATVVCVDPRLESRGSAGKTGFPGMD